MKTPWRNLSARSAGGNRVPDAGKSPAGHAPSAIDFSNSQSGSTVGSNVNDRTEPSTSAVVSGTPLLVLRFPFDVSSVQPEHRQQLADFAADTWPGMKSRSLLVVGFTDDTGPQHYNDTLARRRADRVAKVLRELGVFSVHTGAKGKCCYLSDNATPQGRADNRRVEIQLSFNHENTRSRADDD
ncbi:MAG: OmpA family protein [Candidatus Thiodiazotropha sp.]